MSQIEKQAAHQLLEEVINDLWRRERRPILGSQLKKAFMDKLQALAQDFDEKHSGFENFGDFVSQSEFLAVRRRPGTDILVVPKQNADALNEPEVPTKVRIRDDFWRAFVSFPKSGKRSYYDPTSDEVVVISEQAPQPKLPEIIPITHEQQVDWRREFASAIHADPPLRAKLLDALSSESPLHSFSLALRSNSAVQEAWYCFLSKKVHTGIEDWANRNDIRQKTWLDHTPTRVTLDPKRRKLYAALNRIPVDRLLDLTIPLRWLVETEDKE